MVEDLLCALSSQDAHTKFSAAKRLRELARTNPQEVYAFFDQIAMLAKSTNSIVRWNAIDTIGLLSAVDTEHRCKKLLPMLISYLHSGVLITVNHAIECLTMIAAVNSRMRVKIYTEILAIERDTFETAECKEIAKGKIIESLRKTNSNVLLQPEVFAFIKRATKSSRPATQKKASKMLKQVTR